MINWKRVYRWLIHFPLGVYTAILLVSSPWLGWALVSGFLAYEILEDWRIVDHSYIDVKGWLWGIGVAAGIYMIMREVWSVLA